MTLQEFCIVGDVLEFPHADIPSWGKGRWRVARHIPTIVDIERVEILPLTDTNELDIDRCVTARYFVVIDECGRSGLDMERLWLSNFG